MRGWVSPHLERRVKAIYGTRTDEEVARELGVTLERVVDLAARFCLAKSKAAFPGTRDMPRWDDVEVATLVDMYPGHSNLEIAKNLGRSVGAVLAKAYLMGLKKGPERLEQRSRENVLRRYVGRRRKSK